jgi:uncharacterized protein (DUF3084 family)
MKQKAAKLELQSGLDQTRADLKAMESELRRASQERSRMQDEIEVVRQERSRMIHDLQAARRAMSEANRKRVRGRSGRNLEAIRSPFSTVRSVGAQVIEIIDEDEPLEDIA